MKKTLFVVVLVLALLCSGAALAAGLQEKGFDYYIENGEAIVSGYQGTETKIVVPEKLGGYPVTKLDYECFAGQDGFTSVKLPSTLRVIGWTAFAGCTNLTSIDVPAGVTDIGRYAFSGCVNLESVSLPDSLIHLRRYAFNGCSLLTELVIPANVIEIPGNVLDGTNLHKLTIMGMDTTFIDVPAYVMQEKFGLCDVYCWEGSWADQCIQKLNTGAFPIYYLIADNVAECNPIQITSSGASYVDPQKVTQDNVPDYVPRKPVEKPKLILTSSSNTKGKTLDGKEVNLNSCFVMHEVYKATADTIVYDLSVRTNKGEWVLVTFDPAEPLLLPYPNGVSYEDALKLDFFVEHDSAKGMEYFSTQFGDLVRTKAGLLLYTSSFSPFTLTWTESADPAQLPQTGDPASSVMMLAGVITLCMAACYVLRRRIA